MTLYHLLFQASEEKHRRSDEFDSLCVNVLSSFHMLGKALEEVRNQVMDRADILGCHGYSTSDI